MRNMMRLGVREEQLQSILASAMARVDGVFIREHHEVRSGFNKHIKRTGDNWKRQQEAIIPPFGPRFLACTTFELITELL